MTHWSQRLTCHACGKSFRSMTAEARHRHNFPALCTRNKRFERFVKETSGPLTNQTKEPTDG